MVKHYHFIGIGGIGMSGVAQLLLTRGQKVSGSDVKESALTRSLAKQGAQVFMGHQGMNVAGADIVVYSSAIKDDNPEMLEAKSKGIKIVKRAQAVSPAATARLRLRRLSLICFWRQACPRPWPSAAISRI
jgi:UDP-N-acetylmuramate--alanine ligase